MKGRRRFGLINFQGPGRCASCKHPRRAIIDSHLINETESLAYLAERYRISAPALHRHRKLHLGIVKARTGKAVKNPDRMFGGLLGLAQ